MKPWKFFALASVALNLGILMAVGLFWWQSSEDQEYDAWLTELSLTELQEEAMWSLVDTRFDAADDFFDGLDPKFDELVQMLEVEIADPVEVRLTLNRVEWERGQLSRQLNADLVSFLLTLEPEQRVEALFFLLEAEDLALWFF